MTKLQKSRRHIHDTAKKMRRHKSMIFVISFFLLIYLVSKQLSKVENRNANSTCDDIDVVYTWVNGTDPDFIESMLHYKPLYDPARYDDKQELRYSLRSLELHAPWVRHVFIVTNGQIPHWLDLSYERVTVVTHESLALNTANLPTFSSAAIETFLHRIPGLSKRFLYLNDDVFLGATLYPEDLYTEADGVRIYNAWTVPDCATDCPWVYIGDGACDTHCNIAECQYDGGDCALDTYSQLHNEDSAVHNVKSDKEELHRSKLNLNKTRRASAKRNLILPKSSFKDILKNKNLTTVNELERIVNSFNKQLKGVKQHSNALLDTKTTKSSHKEQSLPHDITSSSSYQSTKDIYSQSLIYTNMLLNRHYGFKARNVLGHVGFLLDRDIVSDMELKFRIEFALTGSHRFRSPDDLQFAFMYYSFLMSETFNATVEEIFDEFDTDGSLTWSDREVRTFLTRMYPLPLDWSAVRYFEEVIENCSRKNDAELRNEGVVYSTLVYERYEDSNVPTITRKLVSKCPLLSDALATNFANRPKYKFLVNSKRGMHSNFMMLTSNVTEVVDALDRIRRQPKKFNCINDNLEPQFAEENELIRHLLEDFYLSFFPRRSKFELHEHYRNRFTSWHEYQNWRLRKSIALFFGYGASGILLISLMRFLCLHKAKIVRRYVQKL